jgi:RNA polymerase sigma factor (sigma-70 family)
MSRPPPSVSPEELLAHAAWLRRLAASLVQPADADDLVQQTWLAALRRPPRAEGSVRPWLATVLRNFARMGARSRPTPPAESEAAPTPDVLFDRLETQRLLARLVSELDEPFRSTVLLRFYEGMSSAEIARAQGLPAGTVRWRLKTALDRLREALDTKAERKTWQLALLPLARARWVRKAVLGVKGLLVMKKIGLVVLILLALGLGFFALRSRKTTVAVQKTAPSAPAIVRSAAPPAANPTAAPVRLVSARVENDPAAKNGSFEGRVINWSSGTGVPSAELTLLHAGATATVTTDANGKFRFPPPATGRFTLQTVTADGYLPFAPEWGHSALAFDARAGLRIRDITLYLFPAVDYTGHVVDPEGHPVAGAQVRLFDARTGEQALVGITDRFTSDAKGEFVFHARDDSILEATDGKHAPGRASLDGPVAVSHQMTIKLGPAGAAESLARFRITGHVSDDRGQPIEGALVLARHEPEAGVLHPIAQVASDERGDFALAGLDAGKYTLAASRRGQAAAERTGVEAGASGISLTLAGTGLVAGRVVDTKGKPVPAFTIVVTRALSALEQSVVTTASIIDGDGRFELRDLPPGNVRLIASAAGLAQSEPVDAKVDDARPVEIALHRGGTLKGKVVDRVSGEALAMARVTIDASVGGGSSVVPIQTSTVTNDGGEFELSGIAPGPRSATVAAYAHHIRLLPKLQFVDDGTVGPVTVDLAPTKPGETPQLELIGIGVSLKPDGDTLLINKVYPESGAADAGIAEGDHIVAVDGVPVAQLGMDGSIQNIRGPEGTQVTLMIRRGEAQTPIVVMRKRLRV